MTNQAIQQSVEIKSLNGKWNLRHEDIDTPKTDVARILLYKEGWVPTPVPGDVHQGLITAGIIEEPTVELNARKAIWTRDKSWWLKKTFRLLDSEINRSHYIELCLDGLDCNAWVFINGELVGEHNSAFWPFEKDIRKWVKPGINTIVVRLTDGLDQVSEDDLKQLQGFVPVDAVRPERSQSRRVFVRKAQYSWGWDWSPESSTTGITGNAFIRVVYSDYIEDVAVRVGGCPEQPVATIIVKTQRANSFKACRVAMNVKIRNPQGEMIAQCEKKTILQSGCTFTRFEILISAPQLWWPSGTGEQPLYTVEAKIVGKSITSDCCQRRFGIRFINIDTEDKMCVVINGKDIFCKGANLIPADMFYARANGAHYRKLVLEAKQANFNMLRIWGGGVYLPDEFYDACDEYGIMVWHDFMFACAPYPDYLQSFRDEVRQEVDYQLKRLRNHPCIVLWCGSNENIWARAQSENKENGSVIAGTILSEAVNLHCPEIPYFYSSPYGDGDNDVHMSNTASGDCHCWDDTMMSSDMSKRIDLKTYDKIDAKFISEYGFPGACGKQTTIDYLGKNQKGSRDSESWTYHYNTFAESTVEQAIAKHYVDPSMLSFDDFLYYSGLIQGRVYAYSLESFRQRQDCYGGLFWMYNDCWGEVGWSIIDYYLRRKISYWFVKRALAPRKLIIRRTARDKMKVTLVNDSLESLSVPVKLAWWSFTENKEKYVVKQNMSVEAVGCNAFEFTHQAIEPSAGFWFAESYELNAGIEQASYFDASFTQLLKETPEITIKKTMKGSNTWEVDLFCDQFAHAVEMNLPGNAYIDDNYFDLHPAHTKKVIIRGVKGSQCPLNVKCI